MKITYRTIYESDNSALATIIKSTLIEYDSATDGTVFTDKGTNALSTTFTDSRSRYFVAYLGEELLGGAGINLLPGESDNVCELQRMFLKPAARNKGIGKKLMQLCLDFAKEQNFTICYLETFPKLKEAILLYEKTGFEYIDHSMGNTGHFACTTRMIYRIE
ncbi:GNAT family N-acetyltransferase [Vicingaceae bacterium]|nr:GNAT family N-acetyltransferase [Vicingaceae bacterium]